VKQNKYDDPSFFAKYSQMPRSVRGLTSAGEWPAFRALLPNLRDKRLLDLGCGFGWHCRYAREQGARFVVGVDLSGKMLARAKAHAADSAVEYRQCAIEDIDFHPGQFEVVISSLALHYVGHLNAVCRNISRWLTPGGVFVFSVEHPVFTAIAAQQWCLGPAGERLHWPVDDYQHEGSRHTKWMADDVIKYHRTAATYVNTIIDSGFYIAKLLEPAPTAEMLVARPEWSDECRRPMFLLISAVKAPTGNPVENPVAYHTGPNCGPTGTESERTNDR
jgi:2-polyprenyl-3-methyl-5-hydroxy-6-metoxy-1,4-benzoquinol methylase